MGTVRLILPEAAHAAAFCRWRADPAARRFNPFDPLDPQQAALRLDAARVSLAELAARHAAGDRSAPSECRRFILEEDGLGGGPGTVAGSVALSRYSARMLTAEIGYQIAPEKQGRGLGAAAVAAFVAQVFAETPLRKIVAIIHVSNTASRRLVERLGFRCEGILREHFLIDGVPVDEAYYGLLRADWEAQGRGIER